MDWSIFRVSRPRCRRDCAIVPYVCASRRTATLLAATRPARSVAARQAADVSQATQSGANIALGVPGYDPANPTDVSAKPEADQLLTTTDVQALMKLAATPRAAVNVNGASSSPASSTGTGTHPRGPGRERCLALRSLTTRPEPGFRDR